MAYEIRAVRLTRQNTPRKRKERGVVHAGGWVDMTTIAERPDWRATPGERPTGGTEVLERIIGKCLAVGILVHLLTTVPALALFAQHGMSDFAYFVRPDYFTAAGTGRGPASWPLILGIVGYGMVLAVALSIMLVAAASWLRRTMPLILTWVSLFLFLRILANVLVDGLKYDGRWRLLDCWNDLGLLGQACLGFEHQHLSAQPQPTFLEAGLVVMGVCVACLILLKMRTRDVPIVR